MLASGSMVRADAQALHVDPRAADLSRGCEPTVSPEWRRYFVAVLQRDPRFVEGRRYLRGALLLRMLLLAARKIKFA